MKKLILFFLIACSLIFFKAGKAISQTGYNAVLEYCTGTWCQWCPCGHTAVHDILLNYPNTVVLAYHGANDDPWRTYSAGIRGIFGFSSYPTGVVGRKTGIISNNAWNNEVVLQSLLIQPGVTINISSKNYDEVSRTLTATVQITANTDLTGDYYVNYVLTENNIVYPQTGNSSCTGGSNYIHYNIVKSMINGDLGEIVNSGNWTTGQMITKSINYTVPNSPQVVNPENCELNIFVYKSGTNISSNSNIQQGLKISLTGTTGISNTNTEVSDYSLSQNYPNPFNPVTTFSFTLPKDGIVSLKIYDILGNEVETYIDGFVRKGSYSAEFDGSGFSSGIYFYKLTSGDFSQTKKMVLSK
ncbi:MAG: Omp28-related outer membrane protein [Ignavibacteria bacterium]|nr:Omp28-related outer membrane protein [Ignavibacteria bacterium]